MAFATTILPNEKELFIRIAQGDETAFTQIFHHYNRRIYPFVLKMIKSDIVAEEIVQEVFLKLWSNKNMLAEIRSPQSYIFKMATNRTLDEMKRISNESRLIKELTVAMDKLQHSEIEEWFDGKESNHLILEAINTLPPQRQKIYKLNRDQGKSYKEIADELNISPSTVKNQLIEAVHSIKEYLKTTEGGSLTLLLFLCEIYNH